MTPVGTLLFSPKPGEAPEAAAKRIEANGATFRKALDNTAGRDLLRLLYSESHPMFPRTGNGLTAEESAFLDGERSLIGLLWLNGTSEKKPK